MATVQGLQGDARKELACDLMFTLVRTGWQIEGVVAKAGHAEIVPHDFVSSRFCHRCVTSDSGQTLGWSGHD